IGEDRNTFVLPPGAILSAWPESASIPSRFGYYQLRVQQRGDNRIEIIRNHHVPAQRIQPWDWPAFRAFLERIELAEHQWIEYRPAVRREHPPIDR
ncbi:MAG: hypothetical protein LBE84_05855, partial [Planctomycetota bacterium]|nr:hypothetical protein [Planctomycetota bacterium]